ncbi:MAG: carboxypeptidase regulatory-like domain-containing protein [Deltaproteobacteria bacterium]|nr:carboxypeptidase regulatory-like domain-containing protein [Deltaproteobacteria bacterium]
MNDRLVIVILALSLPLASCSYYASDHPDDEYPYDECSELSDCNPGKDCGTLVMCVQGACDPSRTVEIACEPECAHLCDCPQGWVCAQGVCADPGEVLGTVFCCENPDCPQGAPCVYRDGRADSCPAPPECDCAQFTGAYCPDGENPCEEVTEVLISGGQDCVFEIAFALADGSTESLTVDGCDSFRRTLDRSGCGVIYSGGDRSFEIACNWCGVSHFDQASCGPHSGYVLHEWGVNTVHCDGSASLQSGPRMVWEAQVDKPVIYIYADGPMTIDVGVTFASGHTTETWPELPNGQSISWDGVAVTQGECDTTPTPRPPLDEIDDREIYQLPEWVVPGADCLTYGDTVSKLLFYAGEMTDYRPPISGRVDLDMDGDGQIHFELLNDGSAPVGPMLLLYRDVDPSSSESWLAWGRVEQIAPGQASSVPISPVRSHPGERPAGWNGMQSELEAMLAGAGLYREEIDVFMGAWREEFFGISYYPGRREDAFVLYLWPESHATAQVPLTLDPPPRELSRVMVEYQRLDSTPVGGVVRGTVMLEQGTGLPGNPSSHRVPAEGATVRAWQDDAQVGQASTDEEGRFELALPAGTYDVAAERGGLSGDRIDDVELPAGETVEVELVLVAMDVVCKPNLYLYPQQTIDVDVTLGLCQGCQVIESEPAYGDGWHVSVDPDGLIDGQYGYLFYEADVPRRYALASGWSVPETELASFFDRTLDAYGLNQTEKADFVDYWNDHLAPAPYYGIYPLVEPAVLDGLVGLQIDPLPDEVFRLWFVITYEQEPLSPPEPEITALVRQGFTAVEWGVILR